MSSKVHRMSIAGLPNASWLSGVPKPKSPLRSQLAGADWARNALGFTPLAIAALCVIALVWYGATAGGAEYFTLMTSALMAP
jgi:hypothetical protein